ncbi:MAG: acyl-CoA dehydrogenase family protein [Natrialbaceae archaeon]|nr:acyl-CoA dehydrogenase family protein [Natrialbaceae archaeon]
MDGRLTPEQQAIKQSIQSLVSDSIEPIAADIDQTASFPESVWDELAALDLTALTVPEQVGGIEADPVTASLVNEEVARGALAIATSLSVHHLATACIAEFGSDAQHERWLPAMAEGRPVGAFALSEPQAGSNPADLQTEARPDGDQYVLNGEKQWITNGKRAGVYILFARTDRSDPATITQFVVPGDVDGLQVGEPEDKLGLRASDTTTLTFENARIPAENRLTPVGDGLSAALHILTGGRVAIASQAVGVAQAALERTIEYCTQREQFGGPIADIQSVQHTVAEMATKTDAARLLAREAARQRRTGDGRMAASMAKYFASETAMAVTNSAVQLHGGYGYVTDGTVERLYRDAKVTEIYEGTTEIQKTVIARELF